MMSGTLVNHAFWVEERRGAVEAQIQSLDVFGWALECTPQRDQFWPAYSLLAEVLFCLRDALALMGPAPAHDSRAQRYRASTEVERHMNNAVIQLRQLTDDHTARRFVERQGAGMTWLDQLPLDHETDGSIETRWDRLFGAYGIVFERLRLGHVASPTGEMDQ